jgi:hypothetical protein
MVNQPRYSISSSAAIHRIDVAVTEGHFLSNLAGTGLAGVFGVAVDNPPSSPAVRRTLPVLRAAILFPTLSGFYAWAEGVPLIRTAQVRGGAQIGLLGEFHLIIRVPADLSDAACDAIRRILESR